LAHGGIFIREIKMSHQVEGTFLPTKFYAKSYVAFVYHLAT
jgi:hypothetical protein